MLVSVNIVYLCWYHIVLYLYIDIILDSHPAYPLVTEKSQGVGINILRHFYSPKNKHAHKGICAAVAAGVKQHLADYTLIFCV